MSGTTLADRLLGLVGGAMVLGALALLLFGGDGDGDAAPTAAAGAPAVPSLSLLSPADGDSVSTPLELRFEAGEEVAPHAGAWGTESLHLHLRLDDGEFMPGPADIRAGPAGGYLWTVPGVTPGEHTVQLYWSDLQHRPIPDGATPAVRLHVR